LSSEPFAICHFYPTVFMTDRASLRLSFLPAWMNPFARPRPILHGRATIIPEETDQSGSLSSGNQA
jgi:hypothetical protein